MAKWEVNFEDSIEDSVLLVVWDIFEVIEVIMLNVAVEDAVLPPTAIKNTIKYHNLI